ncbi:hypothetical protein GUITHDRAFT_102439 [Guillardia theta CCMP2712]|uniref:Uncharacterized protein n=1 Tax=Guillardia theta (strain CCMP2712) TaxID=905079 RepID=L1JUS3_GUITC|nr:hypothetical protein GUITHDRAFT_102439 [Guillardia theta CCMP2712]EKX51828.1 hypothetical protein GUITHDRAFT_102439 [Guillardia theta CCMP2712]|eukprot:XP_005838808.1 hypothetical protein GUITHDRAFT_102439 [Guillardia theta CCMP2712]
MKKLVASLRRQKPKQEKIAEKTCANFEPSVNLASSILKPQDPDIPAWCMEDDVASSRHANTSDHVSCAICHQAWFDRQPSCPVCRTNFPRTQDTNVHSSVWLGSMAVVKNDEQVTAVHKFEQLMDPNNIARAIVPRPINNFMDRLPTEERFAAEGLTTLLDPAKLLVHEVVP